MECVPKKDNMREGEVLNEFLKMMIPKKIEYDDVKSKTDFFKKLENNDSKIVHISCHGDKASVSPSNILPDTSNRLQVQSLLSLILTIQFFIQK